jgi:hypothetical protein
LCTEKELTNNTRCTLHSLTLNPSCNVDATWARIDSAAAGELVLIEPPLSVNVRIDRADSAVDWPADQTLADDGTIVIPLVEQRDARPLKSVKVNAGGKGSSKSKDNSGLQYHSFGVELAFAVTNNKVQGQTLRRVLVDLSSTGRTQHTVSSVYVACSRVRRSEHLRVLPSTPACRQRLESLTFDERLVRWWCSKQPDSRAVSSAIAAAQLRQQPMSRRKGACSRGVNQRRLSVAHRFSPLS